MKRIAAVAPLDPARSKGSTMSNRQGQKTERSPPKR
jgi:hypothetical protein